MNKGNRFKDSETGRSERSSGRRSRFWWITAGLILICAVAVVGYLFYRSYNAPREAPEADRILAVQAKMPFQILIPGYLPRSFKRENVEIKVNDAGPGGEPMVQLAYRTKKGATLFVRQWVPVNPGMEILANSRPIQTKWGKGWLLGPAGDLIALWVDVGPLRASVYTPDAKTLTREQILAMAESLGPASNRQVFSFVVEPSEIRGVPPPPPVEIPVNEEGVQELTLVVTPGGYDPLRFAVKKGIPVRLNFRQLGQVGCGNELIFPWGPKSSTAIKLESAFDKKAINFTPPEAGDYHFICSHTMYRGIMRVRE